MSIEIYIVRIGRCSDKLLAGSKKCQVGIGSKSGDFAQPTLRGKEPIAQSHG